MELIYTPLLCCWISVYIGREEGLWSDSKRFGVRVLGGTGVYWTFTQHFDIGIEGRYSKAEAEFSGKDVELGGTHLGFTLGYSW